eukprot:scaffold14787_cov49-Attheya_sp.AAC.3
MWHLLPAPPNPKERHPHSPVAPTVPDRESPSKPINWHCSVPLPSSHPQGSERESHGAVPVVDENVSIDTNSHRLARKYGGPDGAPDP